MDLKRKLTQEGIKLMSSPTVMKLMQDERVMKALVAAMSVPAKISSFTGSAAEKIAKSMHMATEREVKDLKRTVRKLEEQVENLRKDGQRQ